MIFDFSYTKFVLRAPAKLRRVRPAANEHWRALRAGVPGAHRCRSEGRRKQRPPELFVKLPTSIGELYAPEFLALNAVAVKVAESNGRQPTFWLDKCCLCLRLAKLRGGRPAANDHWRALRAGVPGAHRCRSEGRRKQRS